MTDQPAASDRTAELERRIAELERGTRRTRMEEGRSGIEEAFWAVMHSVFPDEARKHLKSAGREQLLAARVYLDRRIAALEAREASGADAGGPRHERIEVE
jgi:hypothetical protein